MATASTRAGLSWSARLLIGLALILAGATITAWALARYDQAARFLGVAPDPPAVTTLARPQPGTAAPAQLAQPQPPALAADGPRIAELEARLARVETAAERV